MQSRHEQRHKPGHKWVSKWAVCGSSDQSLDGLDHEPENDSSQSCEEGHKPDSRTRVVLWVPRFRSDLDVAGSVRHLESCSSGSTAVTACRYSLWEWEPSYPLQRACPDTGYYSHGAESAAVGEHRFIEKWKTNLVWMNLKKPVNNIPGSYFTIN